jgi:hypothetical protein
VKRLGDEDAFTIVELLVAAAIGLFLLGGVLTVMTNFFRDSRSNQIRNEAQDNARTVIDRISRELRSAVAPSVGSALLEEQDPYGIVFREATTIAPYQVRIRYCLDQNNTLWRQTQTLETASDPLPDTSVCPSSAWTSQYVELGNCSAPPTACAQATNRVGGDTTRPLFTPIPTGATGSQIKGLEVSLYVDENQSPDTEPPATHLTSGIDLRNNVAAPTAQFTLSPTPVTHTTPIQLNASLSTDPQGQVLGYQWYTTGSCPTPSVTPFSTVQSPPPQGPFAVGTNITYLLVVTDTAGLPNCASQSVSVTS